MSGGPVERYDLHVHTTVSDGLMSPTEVLRAATALAGVVLTDHSVVTWHSTTAGEPGADTRFAAVPAVAAAGVGGPVGMTPIAHPLFPGIEISTVHEGRKYHVLGYGRGLLDPGFADYAFFPTRIKNEVYAALVDRLQARGYRIPQPREILAGHVPGSPDAHPGRSTHPEKRMLSKTLIGRHLEAAGVPAPRARDLLAREYDDLKAWFPSRYLPTLDAIRAVREAGAVPAVAHPWWQCPTGLTTWQVVASDLARFARAGLIGLEVSTRHLSVRTEDDRRAVARDLHLYPVAGSDFHANGRTSLGQFGLTRAELDGFRQRAESSGCAL
jgi:hypothetical protein